MNSHVGNFCDNFQMSFETKDLLCLHSCANIKEEISELDATISNDPISIDGTQCARTDLNKRFLPKPMTTTGWKGTP